MKVEIERISGNYYMQAKNENGNLAEMDASALHDGDGKGMSPMELLLSGLGGCSAIDVISILKKKKQNLKNIKIEVDGHREKGVVPAPFTKINLHFKLYGEVEEVAAARAIELSVTKYCSASRMFESIAEITSSFEVINS